MPWSSQVMSGLSVGAAFRLTLLCSTAHENASNWACSAGVTHARSLPFVGLRRSAWTAGPAPGVGAGVDLPSAPTTSFVGATGDEHRAEVEASRST